MLTGRILVTGAAGQLGRALLAADWGTRLQPLGLTRGELDIADPSAVEAALGRSGAVALVNAAAYTAVDRAESEPAAAWRANAEGAAVLAAATAAAGIPLLQLSTDYVFDGRKGAPYAEDDPVAPLSVYGASKAAGEAAVRRLQPRHLVLRSGWVFSAGPGNFLATMLRLAGERDEIAVVDDQRGGPTSADDLAAAVVSLLGTLRPDDPRYGTYHFAGAGETSWLGFAAAIFQRAGWLARRPRLRAIASADWAAPARRPPDSRLDCSRIAAAFALRPRPWAAMLDAVLRQLRPAAGAA